MNELNFPPAFEERMQAYLGEQWKEFAACPSAAFANKHSYKFKKKKSSPS